jgi:hypothetical protein
MLEEGVSVAMLEAGEIRIKFAVMLLGFPDRLQIFPV